MSVMRNLRRNGTMHVSLDNGRKSIVQNPELTQSMQVKKSVLVEKIGNSLLANI